MSKIKVSVGNEVSDGNCYTITDGKNSKNYYHHTEEEAIAAFKLEFNDDDSLNVLQQIKNTWACQFLVKLHPEFRAEFNVIYNGRGSNRMAHYDNKTGKAYCDHPITHEQMATAMQMATDYFHSLEAALMHKGITTNRLCDSLGNEVLLHAQVLRLKMACDYAIMIARHSVGCLPKDCTIIQSFKDNIEFAKSLRKKAE